MQIKNNIKKIEKNIQIASAEVNRHREEITVVAVTKNVDVSITQKIIDFGYKNLGENRVEALLEKKLALKEQVGLKWHFIGTLQSRRVKKIINEIDYLHSLDRLSLAKEIQKRASHTIKCFVEVNVSGEESKHGLTPDALHDFISQTADMDKIQIVGLMTMAPQDSNDGEIKFYFHQLKELQMAVAASKILHAPCTQLSMGMSQDYTIAVEEGATFLRIGTAFFE